MNRVAFPAKLIGETVAEVFDFASLLSVGETISSATCVATVYSGVDASPSAILSGSATISGTKVTQKVTAGTLGVTYVIVCAATTSTSEIRALHAYLTVTPS
tara:strand:- start:5356 stop:5661 length:306 start_codon:yes stop_codon:yes gene_type:complete